MNFARFLITFVFSRFFKKIYICLVPDTFWNFYTQALRSVCQELLSQDKRNMIIALRCNNNLPFCVSSLLLQDEFRFLNLNEKKQGVCKACRKGGNRYFKSSWRLFLIYFLKFDINKLRFFELTTKAMSEFSLFGVPVGKICYGEILRECQIQKSIALEKISRELLGSKILSCCLTIFNLNFFLKLFKLEGLIYFQDYSYNLAGSLFLRKHAVPVFRVSYPSLIGVRPELTIISKNSRIESSICLKESWEKIKNYPLSPQMIRAIALHQIHRMTKKGHTVFSPVNWRSTEELKSYLEIENSKVILLFTSSDDEVQAIRQWAEHYPFSLNFCKEKFKDQIEFINYLANLVQGFQGVWKLVIRAHPREGGFINKRITQPYHQYLPILDKYKFIKLIEPHDNISSYNLFNVADLIATGWSSIGLEALICGAPVVRGFFNEVPAPEKGIFLELNFSTDNVFFAKNFQNSDFYRKLLYGFRWYFWENYSEIFSLNKTTNLFNNLFPNTFNLKSILNDLTPERPGVQELSYKTLAQEYEEIQKTLLLFFDFFSNKNYVKELNFNSLEIEEAIYEKIRKDLFNFDLDNPFPGKQAARLYSLIKCSGV